MAQYGVGSGIQLEMTQVLEDVHVYNDESTTNNILIDEWAT